MSSTLEQPDFKLLMRAGIGAIEDIVKKQFKIDAEIAFFVFDKEYEQALTISSLDNEKLIKIMKAWVESSFDIEPADIILKRKTN